MVEVRVSNAQGHSSRKGGQGEEGIFVFDDESDALLAQRWQRGDLAAASVAIQRHEAMVYSAVYRLLHDHALSEDICQDAFLRAHERIATLRQPGALPGWLRQIAVRLAVDELRRTPSMLLSDDQPDTLPGPDIVVEGLDALQRFRIFVDSLPLAQRSVFVLRDIEGYSIRETAEQLEITEAAVKMRLGRARSSLKKCLLEADDVSNE